MKTASTQNGHKRKVQQDNSMFKTSSADIPLERINLRKPVSESFLALVNVGRFNETLEDAAFCVRKPYIKKTIINRNSPRLDVYRAEEPF